MGFLKRQNPKYDLETVKSDQRIKYKFSNLKM